MSFVNSVDEGRLSVPFRDTTLTSPELRKQKKHTPSAVETTVVLGEDEVPLETEKHSALETPLAPEVRVEYEKAPYAGAPTRSTAAERPLVKRLQTPGGNSSIFFG